MKRVGILTAGGDCPGLNATIRGIALPLLDKDVEIVGFIDGFKGLVENITCPLGRKEISGILYQGGTILGTSRFKPEKYPLTEGGKMDLTDQAVKNYNNLKLDALFCLGGGGTQKNAMNLFTRGIPNIITLPKTIDNDVWGTDYSFGFDSGMAVAAEAIDRLHTTAHSHKRCMLVDVMGNNAGWLSLSAGIAGGADIVLIPEWTFYAEEVIAALDYRRSLGKDFSIVVVAEGAKPKNNKLGDLELPPKYFKHRTLSSYLAEYIEQEMGFEARVTTLGHVQRGGSPTARDRLLATQMGTKAASCFLDNNFGVMITVQGEDIIPIPLVDVAGKKKLIPPDHPLVVTAQRVGISLGR